MKTFYCMILSLVISLGTAFPARAMLPSDPLIPDSDNKKASIELVEDIKNTSDITKDFRGVWVSTVMNLDFPTKKDLSVDAMKAEIDAIVAKTKDLNLNAIMLQVRPTADALYPSKLFPWSEYLTGEIGKAPANGFDPLQYYIEKAHANGLELHAWINPYRVSHSTAKRKDTSTLPSSSPAKKNPSWVVSYKDGLYFDPALPEVRKLVVDGIAEILDNYAVDGIHLDDYFYPGTDFNDAASYKKYGGTVNKNDWRRENVNELIRSIQKLIKEKKPSVRFGVSPFAIWKNKTTDPNGSDTKGYECYVSNYADTVKWVKEGWLDYICPQIYWYAGFAVADYAKLLPWWENICRGTGVDLYIGQAAYREHAGEANWSGEIVRQLSMNAKSDVVSGSIFFRYGSLVGSLGEKVKSYYKAVESPGKTNPIILSNGLSMAVPSKNLSTTSSNYYIMGMADPKKDLFMNGKLVTERTAEGFYSIYVPLNMGENKFVFTQEGQSSITRTITKITPTKKPPTTTKPIKTIKTDAKTPYYATVTTSTAWVYPSHTTTGGSSWQMNTGQRDIVVETTEDKNWIKLGCGVWIEKANVKLEVADRFSVATLTSPKYAKTENIETYSWKAVHATATNVTSNGTKILISFGMQMSKALPAVTVPEDSVISSVKVLDSNTAPTYEFTIKPGKTIEGYYITFSEGYLQLNIKTKKTLSADATKPLTGFSFVIDAGHGASDSGAIGPLGAEISEKMLNLIYAQKLANLLEANGATVTRVRNSDAYFTLSDRVEINRKANPDMFISVHGNSLDPTSNCSKANGITIWYRNPNSKPLADLLMNRLHGINPHTNRQKVSNQSNFYVCRPAYAPSVIIETSFLCNINDFSWLIKEDNQDKMAREIVSSLIEYYR